MDLLDDGSRAKFFETGFLSPEAKCTYRLHDAYKAHELTSKLKKPLAELLKDNPKLTIGISLTADEVVWLEFAMRCLAEGRTFQWLAADNPREIQSKLSRLLARFSLTPLDDGDAIDSTL